MGTVQDVVRPSCGAPSYSNRRGEGESALTPDPGTTTQHPPPPTTHHQTAQLPREPRPNRPAQRRQEATRTPISCCILHINNPPRDPVPLPPPSTLTRLQHPCLSRRDGQGIRRRVPGWRYRRKPTPAVVSLPARPPGRLPIGLIPWMAPPSLPAAPSP